jgi:4-hydroxyproline epimerase
MMSGGFLYPPTRPDADCGILFIETSGCLPMCGHGTIGMVTFALENGLVTPRTPGKLKLEVPAGIINIDYTTSGSPDSNKVTSVKITNVPSYLAATDIEIDVPDFGALKIDVSYGGNYYAIIEPQGPYTGLDDLGAARIIELSRVIRQLVRDKYEPVHPIDPTIRGVGHVLWTDKPKSKNADGRNAVFYGERAIDRSPCGTGTSARLAHLHAKGKLKKGDRFVHESYICSQFIGRVEDEVMLGDQKAIIPSIEGSAISTGFNNIWIDREDTFWAGFQVV